MLTTTCCAPDGELDGAFAARRGARARNPAAPKTNTAETAKPISVQRRRAVEPRRRAPRDFRDFRDGLIAASSLYLLNCPARVNGPLRKPSENVKPCHHGRTPLPRWPIPP